VWVIRRRRGGGEEEVAVAEGGAGGGGGGAGGGGEQQELLSNDSVTLQMQAGFLFYQRNTLRISGGLPISTVFDFQKLNLMRSCEVLLEAAAAIFRGLEGKKLRKK
jgi:hypothetical protein